jgi:hypothetical protein
MECIGIKKNSQSPVSCVSGSKRELAGFTGTVVAIAAGKLIDEMPSGPQLAIFHDTIF